jgi:hypothetical protein
MSAARETGLLDRALGVVNSRGRLKWLLDRLRRMDRLAGTDIDSFIAWADSGASD